MFTLEQRKTAKIQELLVSGVSVLAERSPLSLLYTELAFERLAYTTDVGALRQELEKLVTAGKILLPDHHIILHTPASLAQQRIASRPGTTSPVFADLLVLETLSETLYDVLDDTQGIETGSIVKLDNQASDSLETVVAATTDVVRKLLLQTR
ncbi:MAG: hypothetical protein H6765_00135 [Candidatus Peribacteria bacterium]|nr:MAG: hypothetical protein H6765_00135 [Candidatus Peribacteria bacterium]